MYHLEFACRTIAFFLTLSVFAGLGLLDAALGLLRPAWRHREDAPRQVSRWLPRSIIGLFPAILVIPCSYHRQHRVLRFSYLRRLRPGEPGWVELAIQNTDGETWRGGPPHPLRIGTVNPPQGSAFYVAGAWLTPTRPAELEAGQEVQPRATARFRIPIQAPATPGLYREAWGPLIEGRNWLPALHPLDLRIEVVNDEG